MIVEIWAVLLVGMAILATFSTIVLVALWRADSLYRKKAGLSARGWLARTMATGSVMTLLPSWYFAGTLIWRIVNDTKELPAWMTPFSAMMVIAALGSPVYLAIRVLTVRHGTGEPPPWDNA